MTLLLPFFTRYNKPHPTPPDLTPPHAPQANPTPPHQNPPAATHGPGKRHRGRRAAPRMRLSGPFDDVMPGVPLAGPACVPIG